MTETSFTELPTAEEAGPFCIGIGEGKASVVYPADFNRQREQDRLVANILWWRTASETLKRTSNSKSGRVHQGLCAVLAQAIDSGLLGILPIAFADAAKRNGGTHGLDYAPRQVRAVAYVLANEYGYISDRKPAKRMLEYFGIDTRTWSRWRASFKDDADTFLYNILCDTAFNETSSP